MKHTNYFCLLLFLAFVIAKDNLYAYETHNGGNVSGTWLTGTTHYISASVTIAINTTLTIESGCVVKFAINRQLNVYGTLDVNGTSGSYVIFTSINDNSYGEIIDGSSGSPAAADWYGIQCIGSGSFQGIGYFDYCRLRYGGNTNTTGDANLYFNSSDDGYFNNSISEYSAQYGINAAECSPTINNSTIQYNSDDGIYSYSTSKTPIITNNTFTNNSQYAVSIANYACTLNLYSGNTGSGNGIDAIGVIGKVTSNLDWSSSSSIPISLIGNVTVSSGITLIITGGTLKCNTYVITGSGGTFTLNSGATLEIGSTAGITSSGSTGNIQTTTRTFSTSANYTYNGTASQETGNGLPSSVNNLTIYNSAGVSLSGVTTVNGTLYLTSGALNNSTNNVTIAAGGTISRSTGSINTYPNFGSSVNLEYTGTTGVTAGYEVPSTDIINDLTMNNSGGVTLNNAIKVKGALTLTSGNIINGSNKLTLGNSAGELGTLSRTTGTVEGNFKRWFAASTVSDVLFPIGTSTYYRPATISFTSAPTAGTITAYFTASDPGTRGLPLNDGGTSITNCSSEGFWIFGEDDGLSGGIYSLDLVADGFIGVNDYSTLRILKRAAGGAWTLQGNHSAGTGSTSTPIVHRTGLSGFSEFGIGGGSDNPLPVELSSFGAVVNKTSVILYWETKTEINNYGFEVERVMGSKGYSVSSNWEKIGFMPGHGNSNSPKEYEFVDSNPLNGKAKYRLKQIDLDGKYKYSDVVEVEINVIKGFALGQNYPNPFNAITTIRYQIPVEGFVTLIMYNLLGQEITSLINEEKSPGYYEVKLDGSELSTGIYFYELRRGQFSQIKKLVLLK